MHCKLVGGIVGIPKGLSLDHSGDPKMKLSSATERQAVISDVAHHGSAKSEASLARFLKEPIEELLSSCVEHEIIHGSSSVLPNDVLLARVQENLERVGGVEYDANERTFAEELYATLREPDIEIGSQRDIQPPKQGLAMSSTDVGDVSWNAPTAGFSAASWVPGTPPHSWQAVAAGGSSIGFKGMLVAAQTLAATAVELFADPELRNAARAEFEERIGPDFHYVSLVGDRDPPLDYRR